jgi:hypothetical protein
MPDSTTHKYVGAAAGMGYAAFEAKGQTPLNLFIEMSGGTLAGYFAAQLPDKFEPALSSWHRSFAHSGTTAAALTTAARTKLLDWQKFCRAKADECHSRINQPKMVPNPLQPNVSVTVPNDPVTQFFLGLEELMWHFLAGLANGLAAGYVSHIVLDALSPRSVPLLVAGF